MRVEEKHRIVCTFENPKNGVLLIRHCEAKPWQSRGPNSAFGAALLDRHASARDDDGLFFRVLTRIE